MVDTTVVDTTSPLMGFTRLSEQVYMQPATVPTDLHTVDPSHPTTVIIYGWGDASPKHVSKYVDGYLRLFPHAKLVLIFSPILRAIIQHVDVRTRNMEPVLDAVFGVDHTHPAEHKIDDRILAHVMSNTGGINFASTLNAYLRRHSTTLPHRMLVCDSTPGSVDFMSNLMPWSRAMALGVASWFPWPFVVTQFLAGGFLATLHGMGWVLGRTSAAEFSTGAVSDPAFSTTAARKLYLYSKEDDIIYWEDIEAHAALSRERGYAVDAEMFDGTTHVGHMRKHPEQYWAAIARTWGETAKGVAVQ
ncbi:hypothetical protein B0T25DRAFT_448780 [Lasiosphaeria hispida]|uniref:DUF829-domain-containing protein n=1 Tax=Lasiosphaeria hispida TaxID=260671 RepID=A0AAJ0HS50_9PEZI|nr:hypothetical protein B0T25DRAFT_448780 [Lasiosphaeria hispida]